MGESWICATGVSQLWDKGGKKTCPTAKLDGGPASLQERK